MEKITSSALRQYMAKERNTVNRIWSMETRELPGLDARPFQRLLSTYLNVIFPIDAVVLEIEEGFYPVFHFLLRIYKGKSLFYPSFMEEDLLALLSALRSVSTGISGYLAALDTILEKLNRLNTDAVRKWMRIMILLGGCELKVFKERGLIAAWKSGMAAYRESALDLLSQQSPESFQTLFDLKTISAGDQRYWIGKMRSDLWICPGKSDRITTLTRGGFTGWGGQFTYPPLLYREGDLLCVSCGQDHYRLYMDAYGIQLMRREPVRHQQPVHFLKDGPGGLDIPSEWPTGISSICKAGNAWYFTSPLSHHIFVAARHD